MADLAVGVVIHLIDKALSFVEKELSRKENVMNDVEEIKNKMSFMNAYLHDVQGIVGGEVMNHLVHQIRDLSHRMEDVLDEYMIHTPRCFSDHSFLQKSYQLAHDLKHRNAVSDIQSQIAHIKNKTSEIMRLYIPPSIEVTLRTNPIQQAAAGSQVSPRGPKIVEDQDGFLDIESPRKALIDMLTSDSRPSPSPSRRDSIRCKTISVVGPGGSGKTVLVNAVYKSMAVMGKFHCHAWLSIPKSYKTEQLLQQLASRMCTDFPAGAHPATVLSKFLVGKRYLIVFDYVDQDMRDILRMLPDYKNGSRIIITTRYDEVADKCCTSDEYILRINGLDEKQSWKLFTKKAFGNGGCPDHLHDLAQGIVRRCDGLPQAISAVGSLLSRKGDQPAEWKRIHDNLGTHIQEDCISAMLPSYYDLPSDLKMCLLYFGILREDRSIKRERLIRLWLSEGVIVKNHGKEQLETAAEESLNELISRNLVTATSRDFRGRVTSCCVQNMLRELILQRSKDEQFMEVITDSNIYPGPGVSTKTRRLSIDCAASSAAAFTRAKGFQLDKIRSLFMFGLDRSSSSRLPEILQKVRLLKILDLENAPLDDFPECLLEVAFLLRYLSLRNTKVSVVPKNIKKLRYLEHLDLKETQVTALPEEICSLQYLQQLLVSFGRLQGVEIEGELRVLHFLQKLSIIKVGHNRRFFEFLRQLPLLKKLSLVNVSKDNGKDLCACIEEMSYLSTLDLTSKSRDEYLDLNHMKRCPAFIQHLYLIGRLKALPAWIPSLSALVRLILSWSKLSDSPVKLLQKMPNLLELKMIDAFTGEALSVCEGGFPKLRMLHIEQFGGLAKIEVSDEAMFKLQKLILVGCHRLHDLGSRSSQVSKSCSCGICLKNSPVSSVRLNMYRPSIPIRAMPPKEHRPISTSFLDPCFISISIP